MSGYTRILGARFDACPAPTFPAGPQCMPEWSGDEEWNPTKHLGGAAVPPFPDGELMDRGAAEALSLSIPGESGGVAAALPGDPAASVGSADAPTGVDEHVGETPAERERRYSGRVVVAPRNGRA